MYHGEKFNAWTHLIGALLACAGAIWLLVLASLDGEPRKIVSVAIYGLALVLLYSISTLYHSLRGSKKLVMRKLDHLSIYLLIAGSYTPFCLVTLHGPWGWWLFGTIWTLAILGVAFKAFYTGRFKRLSTIIYVAMGWIAVVAIEPMIRMISAASLLWLLAGGVFYTLGTVFYMSRRRYAHAIWHAFVLGGSISHFVAVWLLVVEPAAAG